MFDYLVLIQLSSLIKKSDDNETGSNSYSSFQSIEKDGRVKINVTSLMVEKKKTLKIWFISRGFVSTGLISIQYLSQFDLNLNAVRNQRVLDLYFFLVWNFTTVKFIYIPFNRIQNIQVWRQILYQ